MIMSEVDTQRTHTLQRAQHVGRWQGASCGRIYHVCFPGGAGPRSLHGQRGSLLWARDVEAGDDCALRRRRNEERGSATWCRQTRLPLVSSHSRRNSFPPGLGEEFRRPSFAGVIVASTPRMCIVIYIVSCGRDEQAPCRGVGLRRGDER